MIDGLPEVELPEAVDLLLGQWPTDAVAGELWRYVRDRAYERYDRHVEPTRGDSLDQVLCLARKADAQVTAGEGSSRYQEMRRVAHIHLRELAERYPEQAEWLTGAPGGREEGTANSDGPIAGLRRLFGRLRR